MRFTRTISRGLALALFVAGMALGLWFFGSQHFSAELWPSPELQKLQLQALPSPDAEGAQSGPVNAPLYWSKTDQNPYDQRRFRVIFPDDVKYTDHVLYIASYRQYMEISLQGQQILAVGRKQHHWMTPFVSPVTIPLDAHQRLAELDGPLRLDIELSSNAEGLGGLGGVWFGPADAVERSRKFVIDLMPTLLNATLGVLCALLVFVGLDALQSRTSRQRLLITLPHLLFAVLCIPSVDPFGSMLWLKLYQLSVYSIATCWIFIGFNAIGEYDRRVRICLAVLFLSIVPVLFISDGHSIVTWVLMWLNPLFGVVGCVAFVKFSWHVPDKGERVLYWVFMVAGTLFFSAGVWDILLKGAGNVTVRPFAFPVGVMFSAFVIFVWSSLEMRQRQLQLTQHQDHLRDLYNSRSRALEETQLKLMQHTRHHALNSKGAAISHEIRNPLGALTSDLALLHKKLGAADCQVPVPIERMQRTIERIDQTLIDLSDFSRKQSIDANTADLSQWLRGCLSEPEFVALLSEVSLNVDIERDLHTFFDPMLMRRALVNVIENARNSVAGSRHPQIWLRAHSVGGNTVIELRDSGVGFNEEDIETLCEPLVSKSSAGMGLGLTIVRDIMMLHQGEVRLRNRSDAKGAEVSLIVPQVVLSPI